MRRWKLWRHLNVGAESPPREEDWSVIGDGPQLAENESVEVVALSEVREALLGEAERLERLPAGVSSGSRTHATRVAKAQAIREAVAAAVPSTDSEGQGS
jgi:hypothetical protein